MPRPVLALLFLGGAFTSALATSVGLVGGEATSVAGGGATVSFTLVRSGSGFVTARYATQDGSAVAGADYVATSGTVMLEPGANSVAIDVPVIGHAPGPDKQFTLRLQEVSGSGPIPAFAAAQATGTGAGAVAIQTADLDRDGRVDVVSANGGDTLSSLLNRTSPGAATMQFNRQDVALPGAAPAATLADFNNDGAVDLAAADADHAQLAVLLNQTATGASTLSLGSAALLAIGATPTSVTAGDVNADGRADLVVAHGGSSGVTVFLNQTPPGASSASFGPAQPIAAGGNGLHVVAHDFNADGRPDLALVKSGGVGVLVNATARGATTAAFAAPIEFDADGSRFAAVADLNRDGRADLATALGAAGAVAVRLNTTAAGSAAASFAPPVPLAVPGDARAVAAGDVNRDGKLDLLVALAGTQSSALLLNRTAQGAGPRFASPLPVTSAGLEAVSSALADVNGDGAIDALLLKDSSVVAHAVSLPANEMFGDRTMSFAGTQLAAADLNADGRADLAVTVAGSDSVSVWMGGAPDPVTGAASYSPGPSFGVGDGPRSLAAADFNGDGRQDVVVANEAASSLSFLTNTTPAGSPVNFARNDLTLPGAPSDVTVLDVNGDGRPDLYVSLGSSGLVLMNTSAPGAASATFAYSAAPAAGGRFALAVDMNLDGRSDLVGIGLDGGVLVNVTPPGAAAGSFVSGPFFSEEIVDAVADLNLDRRPDLVLRHDVPYASYYAAFNQAPPGNTALTFFVELIASFDEDTFGHTPVVRDFDGDGRPDLRAAIWSDPQPGQRGVIHLQARNLTAPGSFDAQFQRSEAFTPQSSFSERPLAKPIEADGDGLADTALGAELLLGGVFRAGAEVAQATGTIHYQGVAPLSFAPVFGAAAGTEVFSQRVTIQAGPGTHAVSLSGDPSARWRKVGGSFASAPGTVQNGDQVQLKMKAGAAGGGFVQARLVVGDAEGVWQVQTAVDSTPDPFTFANRTGVSPGAVVQSDAVVMTGINARVPVSITGHHTGRYYVDKTAFACCATIGPGQSLRLRLVAPDQEGASRSLTVDVGGVTATWTITTTVTPDTVPNPFSFPQVNDAPSGVNLASDPVVIGGINQPASISVSGHPSARYRVNAGGWTAAAGVVSNGDVVRLQVVTANNAGSSRGATLDVGGVTATWKVYTGTDTTPKALSFSAQQNVPAGSARISNEVLVTGISVPVTAAAFGDPSARLSINGGAPTTSATVVRGDLIRALITAPVTAGATAIAEVDVGDLSTTWSVTTAP